MLHLIVNPKSGRGKADKYCARIGRACDRRHVAYETHRTEYAGHCRALIGELEARGEHDFLIFGGDGTFHEALNGVTDLAATRLGLIPCGSGNDFTACDSRAFHVGHPLRALDNVLAGKTRKLDFIQFANGYRCLNIAGTGLDIEVLLKARAIRRLTGSPNYLKALLRVLRDFRNFPLTVTADGVTERYEALMLGVCNGRQIGGGIKINPHAVVDDGRIQLVIVKDVPRERIKRVLPRFLTGTADRLDCCVIRNVERVRVACETEQRIQLDGEIYSFPFDCRLVRGGLTVFR